MSGSTKPARRRLSAGWRQVGLGMAIVGLVVAAGITVFWGLLIGPGDSQGVLWRSVGLLMGVPTLLGIAGIVLLARHLRAGFWFVAVQLAVLSFYGLGDGSGRISGLAQAVLLGFGAVLCVVGFFRARTAAST